MRLFFFFLLVSTASLFLWRFLDYIDEAAHDSFHITRAGLDIYGNTAQALQIVSIALAATLFLFSVYRMRSALAIR